MRLESRTETDERVDRALRDAFGSVPREDPGLEFHHRLRLRLEAEPARQDSSLTRWMIQLYSILALGASGLILGLLPWSPNLLGAPFWTAFSCLAAIALVPSLLLRRLNWIELLADRADETPRP